MDESLRKASRRRQHILIAAATLFAALLVVGGIGIVALTGKSSGTTLAAPHTSSGRPQPTVGTADPSAEPTSKPGATPSGSNVPSLKTPAGSRSPSAVGRSRAGLPKGSRSSTPGTQRNSFRVTAVKVYVTSASYRVVMSTKGGPPWTPFTLTVTASPGLVASGARGQPVVISGAPPDSYGGAITSGPSCQDWTITATVAPGSAAPGGLTGTGVLRHPC